MSLGNTGIPSSYKRPGYLAKIIFGSGAVSSGSQRLKCLLVGMKTAAGTMVADQDVIHITSDEEAVLYAGARSELALMAHKALQVDAVDLYIAAVTEPPAGTQATLTILLAGTVGNGTLRFRLAGVPFAVAVNESMTIDDVGTAIAAALNAKTTTPATAAYDSGTDTVTLTIANKGATGKDWVFYHDTTDAPAGLTLTITGSATLNTGGYRFGAGVTGTGAPDVTTLLTKLTSGRYARIGVAQNDATNAALWEAHVNTKSGPMSLNLEHLVFGHNGTLVAAQSIAQTTLNAFRGHLVHIRNSESHPAEIAAAVAAVRSTVEQASPVPDYDGYVLSMLAPQAFPADSLTDPEQDTALNNGVTPAVTVNGEVRIVRAITTYCLNGASQDERCLDIGDAVMTDYATLDYKLMWETDFRPANPYVGPNPAEGEEPPPAGVAFPDLWSSKVAERNETYYANGWLENRPVGIWKPVSDFNKPGRYIVSEVPLPVRRVQHRLDHVVRQVFNS